MQTHKHILNGKRQPPILTIHFDWSVGLAEGVLDHTFVGAKVTDVDLLDCELHHHLVVAGFVRRRFKAFAWVEMRREEQTQPQWVAVYWLGGYWLLHWMLLWVCFWFEMMFAVLRGTVCTVIFLLDFTEVTLHDTTGRDRHRSLTVSLRSLEGFKCCCCVYTVE